QGTNWSNKAGGWRSSSALKTQFDSDKERDANIRTWIKGSAFPQGSGYYIDNSGHVVVTPP
ncbi:MAG: hypothetical protein KDK99_11540, partial [Verrucomicrobiales bacterium]|nr:hypothetical protein [Verrucomicrobiales bacterium]